MRRKDKENMKDDEGSSYDLKRSDGWPPEIRHAADRRDEDRKVEFLQIDINNTLVLEIEVMEERVRTDLICVIGIIADVARTC